jgi:hypothetical protein
VKKSDATLAIIFGKTGDDAEYPPDFEDEAIKAFPELDGDKEKMMAFWKAIRSCMEG